MCGVQGGTVLDALFLCDEEKPQDDLFIYLISHHCTHTSALIPSDWVRALIKSHSNKTLAYIFSKPEEFRGLAPDITSAVRFRNVPALKILLEHKANINLCLYVLGRFLRREPQACVSAISDFQIVLTLFCVDA